MKKVPKEMRQEGSAVPGPEFVRVCEKAMLCSLMERGLLSLPQMERCVERLEKRYPKSTVLQRHDQVGSRGGCL